MLLVTDIDPPRTSNSPTKLTGKDAARIHLGLVLCLAICIPAFVFEVYRAVGGNSLSWAYVFEWPILAGFGIYMWWKLLRPTDAPAPSARSQAHAEAEDADLAAWNRYLAELAEHDKGTD